MSIAENIRRIRQSHNMTQEEFGKIADVSAMAVSQWENDRAVPRMGSVQRLSDYFRISKGDIIDERYVEPPANAIPIRASRRATAPLVTLGRVHAGEPVDEETCDGTVDVPASVADAHPHAFMLLVEGDCMDRLVPDGCHVMVDPDVEPHDGSVAVVETQGYQTVMRRWFRGATTLLLRADSFEPHDDIVMTGDAPVRVVGTVVWFQSAGEMA